MEAVRINKYLSEVGVCSRREADKLIQEGRVLVDGLRVEMGQKVTENSVITIDGKRIKKKDRPVLLAVYKPVGVVTTSAEDEKANIVTYVGYKDRIYPIGRLDKDSEGLILMTNQGDLANRIAHARGCHEKEYLVTVNRPVTREFIDAMMSGVRILDGKMTRRCKAERISKFRFRIVLTQGMNRQIRRMCEALDYEVKELKRVRIMNILLGDMQPGEWREIAGDEYETLLSSLDED